MKRATFLACVVGGTIVGAQAAPPGLLDGQSIPTDYAGAKLLGVQTNHTGVGDVTTVTATPVYTEGSELDALYLAKDNQFLYVGLAGNLLEVGSPFVIFIDSEFDFGQTELRTEGVAGPAFVLQQAGRAVIVSDNGTPNEPNDDTYVVDPNSGMMLPDCGDPGFTGWDYALAIDASDNGEWYAHEYALFGFAIGTADPGDLCYYGDGRVSCDPTPDNTSDPQIPIYAVRNLVASSPLGDGNETLEGGQPAFGYQRGGFDNSNTAGVTDTDASAPASATTGLEIAIPLANIGSGVFIGDTINLMVLTMDGDEHQTTTVSDGYGAVLNQALPSITGPSCNPPQSLGLRPDLRTIASCLSIDTSTLANIDTGAVLDGVIVASDYATGAPLLSQSCPTSGGDQAQLPDVFVPGEDGSELDVLYADHDGQFVYLGMTGNLQAGGTSINVFIDADGGSGDALISDFSNFTLDGTYEQWDPNETTSDAASFTVVSTDWGGGFKDISPNIFAPGATELVLDVTVNAGNLADTVRVVLADADGTERFYDFAIPGVGAHTLVLPISGWSFQISPGTTPGLDLGDLNFFHIAGGFNNGDPGVAFDVTFDNLALRDDDQGDHVLDFVPGPNAYEAIDIETFSNFNLLGTYVSWSDPNAATFTSGANTFRVETSGGFGGGFFDISPNVNLTGAVDVQLEVTIGPGSTTGTLLVVLADSDDTQLRWSWPGLTPGTYSLSADFASGIEVLAGAVPGFDLTDVSFCHLQGNFATTDITYDNLAVRTVLPGVSPIISMNGNALANGPVDTLGNGLLPNDWAVQYDYAYGINLSYTPLRAYVDYFDLVNDTFVFRGAMELDSGSATLFDDPGGQTASNPNGMMMAFHNQNTMGVIGCDPNAACFADDPNTVAAMAHTAADGVEMAIPFADLGIEPNSLPRIIQVWTMIGDRTGFAANQSLPSMRNASYEQNQVLNPGGPPVDFTSPASGPTAGALLSNFTTFDPNNVYGVWAPNDFTLDPNGLRVQSTDWGGAYAFLSPWADATGATEIELEVTLNPANQTDKVVVVLFDGDGTVWVYRWDDLTNGSHVLSKAISDIASEDAVGSEPGLDLANIGQFNIAGAFHNGNPGLPLDITFKRLELVGGIRNFEARAARFCLSTIAGDGDCDGDNDMIDIALLQQCMGSVASPVFPMECEQLDLVKDGVMDDQDAASFVGLITGP